MDCPIIFIHRGNNNYLMYALSQARYSNPDSRIILLGDEQNNHYSFIEHYNINEFINEASKFANYYIHLNNPDAFEYELFCIQRWFVLKEFMVKHNLSKCFHSDSDIMIYGNITNEYKNFKDFDMSIAGTSGHSCYISNRPAIEFFCNFINETYQCNNSLNNLKLFYKNIIKIGAIGGVCDMTILNGFKNHTSLKIGIVTDIANSSVFDHNFNRSHKFKTDKNGKIIHFINNQPFCKLVENNKNIRFNTIHFQGSAKKYMKKYYKGDKFKAAYYLLLNIIRKKPLRLLEQNIRTYRKTIIKKH